MPSLLRYVPCDACGGQHNFNLLTGELSAADNYDYVCPVTGDKARMRPTGEGERMAWPPQGAVVLTRRAA